MLTESAYLLRFKWAVALMLGAAPLVVWLALGSIQSMYTSPVDWVPESDPARRAYESFTDQFGREDAVVVGWKGCTIDDRRLHHLRLALLMDDRERVSHGQPRLFRHVFDGYSLSLQLYELVRDTSLTKLKSEEIRRIVSSRLLGTFLGPDGSASCAVVTLSETGLNQRRYAIKRIREIALNVCHQDNPLSASDVYLAGPPVEAATIDEESVQAIMFFSVPSALFSLLLCWICLRSLPYTIAIVLTAAYGEGLVLAMVFLAGVEMNAVLVIMPALVFVLTTSAGIHLTNYYIDEVRSRGAKGSVTRALHHGWVPCLLAVGTTVLGLGSLMVSQILPIRQFGLFSSIGLIAAVCLLFLTLPGVLSKWHYRRREGADSSASRSTTCWNSTNDRPARYVVIACDTIMVVFVLLMLAFGLGLPRLAANADVRSLVKPRNRLNQDIARLEQSIGPLTPVEILLRYKPHGEMNFVSRLELIQDLERKFTGGKLEGEITSNDADSRVRGTISAATFAPEIYEKTIRRAVQNRLLLKNKERFVGLGFLSFDESSQVEVWRISARVDIGDNLDYQQYLDFLRQKISKAIGELADANPQKYRITAQDYEITLTGGMPLSDRAHRTMLRDMYRSLFTAAILVALAMIFTLRHIVAGLLVMLPNLFPIILVFGIMGWTGIQLDIGTIMTASVALGIAVDDTLHFVAWYRRETAAGSTPLHAAKKSMRHCGKAMVQTTLICGVGLSILGLGPVFGLSDFLPIQRFGFMMFVLLASALVGDLVLLPAILVGPVGRFFTVQKLAHTALDADDDDTNDKVAARTT